MSYLTRDCGITRDCSITLLSVTMGGTSSRRKMPDRRSSFQRTLHAKLHAYSFLAQGRATATARPPLRLWAQASFGPGPATEFLERPVRRRRRRKTRRVGRVSGSLRGSLRGRLFAAAAPRATAAPATAVPVARAAAISFHGTANPADPVASAATQTHRSYISCPATAVTATAAAFQKTRCPKLRSLRLVPRDCGIKAWDCGTCDEMTCLRKRVFFRYGHAFHQT